MSENLDLQKHIEKGVEKIVTDAIKATLKDPRESAFMIKFAAASKKAAKIRMKAEEKGDHTPGFLIASITSRCNLHCAGCYSRCMNNTTDDTPVAQLTSDEWMSVFKQAQDMGISFILLAGGEPLLRKDVIAAAGNIDKIIFPIFTNGTCIGESYMDLFDRHRNLIPVLSIEGGENATDNRRGTGMYEKLTALMDRLGERRLLFGASITVTTENIEEVTSPEFIETLTSKGCKLVLFIEFVPVTDEATHLAPTDKERKYLADAMDSLRVTYPDLLLLSFPGDELAMGGCMAAGREFFHINSHGGAEPCPFSPYSDINVKTTSLHDALHSGLFTKIRESGLTLDEHAGGCVLFEKRAEVEKLLNG